MQVYLLSMYGIMLPLSIKELLKEVILILKFNFIEETELCRNHPWYEEEPEIFKQCSYGYVCVYKAGDMFLRRGMECKCILHIFSNLQFSFS